MTQPYTKPHLTLSEQLAKLKDRGVRCTDDDEAMSVLRAAGYYRLSAYVYPFRELLSVEAQPASPTQYRSEKIRSGTDFSFIEGLWRFDRKLRLLCLDGLETIEIGLRTQIAYVLGRRNRFGHLDQSCLDPDVCSRLVVRSGVPSSEFDEWRRRYEDLQAKACTEDFVRHNLAKYGSPLPVWVAVEFLDFGAAVRLYGLMARDDKKVIADSLGIGFGGLLHKWFMVLNYIRNTAAHHARLWNRKLTLKPAKFREDLVPKELVHAAQAEHRDKIYVSLALIAYLAVAIDPKSNWPNTLRTLVRKFPRIPGITPESHMGFPEGWEDLPLWTMRT